MKVGDKAYIIESGRKVREVELVGVAGDGFIVRFLDTGGGICVNRSRLFKLGDLPKRVWKYRLRRRVRFTIMRWGRKKKPDTRIGAPGLFLRRELC